MLAQSEIAAILGLRQKGTRPKAIAQRLGVTRGQVAGVIYRHEHAFATPSFGTAIKASSAIFPAPQFVIRPENQDTDISQWIGERDKLLSTNEFVRVMHLNDLHFPYYDPLALDTWFAIAERFKPQIIALGSDEFDLPQISSFEADRDIPLDDWQERNREYHWPLINRLNKLLPDSLFVWFFGNHSRRALKSIKASDSPRVGVGYFLETIRANGRVLFMGRTEHIEVGKLIVTHGNKANKYAAASMGAYPEWLDKKVNFGHIHRHQKIGNAWSNGCLCQLVPHYDDWGYPVTQEQGTSTILASKDIVLWDYHHFERAGAGIVTPYYGDVLKVE